MFVIEGLVLKNCLRNKGVLLVAILKVFPSRKISTLNDEIDPRSGHGQCVIHVLFIHS